MGDDALWNSEQACFQVPDRGTALSSLDYGTLTSKLKLLASPQLLLILVFTTEIKGSEDSWIKGFGIKVKIKFFRKDLRVRAEGRGRDRV